MIQDTILSLDDKTTIRRELLINQAVDARLNIMLVRMQQMMDDNRIWQSKMELSQIQNVLAVALDTNSVEVVKNYLRYQIGRDTTAGSWRRRLASGPTFGEIVIAEIDRLNEWAVTITNEEKGTPLTDKTWMNLTRLYLGYMRRYFYYQKRAGG